MLLSNPVKSFPASILLLIFSAGCGTWQTGQNTAVPLVSTPKSEFPFETKEPEIFQCEIVVKAGSDERKIFVARKGLKQRIDYDLGSEKQHSIIKTDKEILVAESVKVYAEKPFAPQTVTGGQPLDDYTSLLLNRRDFAEFEEAGSENNLKIYRAWMTEGSISEALIYVDPGAGIPVKQQFFSINGAQKTLQYSVELRNYSVEVTDSVFEIPAGYRKVSLEEFYRMAAKFL